MREVGIVRGDGGGVHRDHVATPRGVCERDKARMNMIRGIKRGRVLGSNSVGEGEPTRARRGDTSLSFVSQPCHRILFNKTKRTTKTSQKH